MKNNNEEKDLNIVNPEDLEEKDVVEEAIKETAEAVETEEQASEIADETAENIEETAVEAVESLEVVNADADDETDEPKKKMGLKTWLIAAALILAIVAVGFYTYIELNTLATYKGGRVTNSEFEYEWEAIRTSQGITDEVMANEEYAESIQALKDNVLVNLGYQEVIFAKLKDLDMDELTEEESEQISESANSELDNYATSNLDYIMSTLPEDATEEDVDKAIEDFKLEAINESGYKDVDEYVDMVAKSTVIENAYFALLPDDKVMPTVEELQADFDALMEDQKTRFSADPNAYFNEMDYTDFIVYKPEGIRNVRHVLFMLSDESMAEISKLTQEGDQEGADKVLEEAYKEIEPLALEILEKLQNGEMTFEEAIEQYNEDPGLNPAVGYEVCEGYQMFVPEFTEGAMSLENIGDITDLVATSYGYHIIEYFSDQEEQEIAFEEVEEGMRSAALNENRTQAWYDLLDSWYEELELTFKDEALNDLAFS